MKTEISIRKNKKTPLIYLFAVNLMFSLIPFSFTNIFGQISDVTGKKPLDIEIITQTDCPLLISSVSVDNTEEDYQLIYFVVQNISSKNIKSYVLVSSKSFEPGGGGSITAMFQKPFVPLQMIQQEIREERVNIKSGDKMFLSFDYVEFDDGSAWGNDVQKQSEHIAGMKDGQKNALNQIKDLMSRGNKTAFSDLFQQEISEIKAPIVGNKKSDKWQRGFSSGYKFTLGRFKLAYEKQGLKGISLKLEELENLLRK